MVFLEMYLEEYRQVVNLALSFPLGIFGQSKILRVAAGLADLIDSIVGVKLSDFHGLCTFGG